MNKWLWPVVGTLVVTSIMAVVLYAWNTSRSAAPNPAVGLITNISEASVALKTDDGQDFAFINRDQSVSVNHLKEHMVSKEPVSITWQAEGNQKIATRIDDAR